MDKFDNEKKHIWNKFADIERLIDEKFSTLESEILKSASDAQRDANYSSRKVTEYKNKALESKNEAINTSEEILNIKNKVTNEFIIFEDTVTNASSLASDVEKLHSSAESKIKELDEWIECSQDKYSSISEILEKHTDLENVLENTVSSANLIQTNSNKVKSIVTSSMELKNKIDEAYTEIYGFEEEDEDGNISVNEGKLALLENVYEELNEKISTLDTELSKYKKTNTEELNSIINTSINKIDKFITEKEELIKSIEGKINSLLPRALTTGLSSAYQAKKEAEEENYLNLSKTFVKCILGLMAISLIPIGINFFMVINGKELTEALKDTPQVILGLLPAYLPIMWLAMSNNKKINLSKRLIEEYTHKEVLSKTYEGLSTQINNIKEETSHSQLKNKLLFNLLDVNAENPGKLISNYDKSDHPLMEVLDRSSQLATSIEKLSKIPGVRKVAQKLVEKNSHQLKEQDSKVNEAIDSLNDEKDLLDDNQKR